MIDKTRKRLDLFIVIWSLFIGFYFLFSPRVFSGSPAVEGFLHVMIFLFGLIISLKYFIDFIDCINKESENEGKYGIKWQ